jgi:hypothetical protein
VPSVVLLRGRGRTRVNRVEIINQALCRMQLALGDVAVVVVDGDRLRIRRLPISRSIQLILC